MTVPLCASCPAPQGMSQGWAHPLPLGCGHWVHTSCSRAENIPFPVLPKGPRESGLVWGRKMGMQRKWAEGPKGDTSTRGLLARRHVKPSHQVQTRGGRRPSGKSSAASGATSRHGAAGDPLQPLRGCARGGPHPVTSLWSSCVRPRPHGFGPRWTCRRLGCLPWCPHRFGERGILPGKRRTLGQAGGQAPWSPGFGPGSGKAWPAPRSGRASFSHVPQTGLPPCESHSIPGPGGGG